MKKLINMIRNTHKDHALEIYASIFSCLLCIVLLCATTYAYFLDTTATGSSPFVAGNYSVGVGLVSGGDSIEVSAGDQVVEDSEAAYIYICPFVKDDMHTFVFTATGTATTGYCKIVINDDQENTYYTNQIPSDGREVTLTIQAKEGSKIAFYPQWGSNSMNISLLSDEGYIAYSNTPYFEYIVVENAVLEAIAEYYGVSAESICIFNGITDVTTGQIIKIPGTTDKEPFVPVLPVSGGDAVSSGDAS